MIYQLFEGTRKKLRKPKNPDDESIFNEMKEKFGFKEDIDLATFCVATALYKEYLGGSLEKNKFRLGEMTNIYSFDKAHLYDYLIMFKLDIEKNRLDEFEKYFCTGFKILKQWINDFLIDAKTEIERFYLIRKCLTD